jgi:hypothetical protein
LAIKGLGDGTASTETLSRLKKEKPEISETSNFFCGCDEPAFGGEVLDALTNEEAESSESHT